MRAFIIKTNKIKIGPKQQWFLIYNVCWEALRKIILPHFPKRGESILYLNPRNVYVCMHMGLWGDWLWVLDYITWPQLLIKEKCVVLTHFFQLFSSEMWKWHDLPLHLEPYLACIYALYVALRVCREWMILQILAVSGMGSGASWGGVPWRQFYRLDTGMSRTQSHSPTGRESVIW